MKGTFSGPVRTEWIADNPRDMVVLNELRYTDSKGKVWTARAGSVVNGASIPRPFWHLIGSPFCGRYRRASVIHDVYSPSNEPWWAVHRVFLEMMETDGVPLIQRNIMFLAVWCFAKRWEVADGIEIKKTA